MKPHPYDLNEEHEEAFTFQRPEPIDEKTRAEDDAARTKITMPPPTREEVNALIENPPAFPFQPFSRTGFARDTVSSQGMTLRDWFAGQALAQTYLAHIGVGNDAAVNFEAAQHAYALADAMLAARTKGTP